VDEERLTADIIELARQHGRYGYRKIAEFLRRAGWLVNASCAAFPGMSVPIMAPAMSPAIWPNGSVNTTSSTFAGPPIIR